MILPIVKNLRRNAVWWMSACVVCALGIRILYVLLIANAPPTHDARAYDTLGQRILKTADWYNEEYTSKRAPLYPVIIAGVYAVAGISSDAVQLVQAVLSSCVCVLIFALGCKLYDEKTGLIAAWIYALYPLSIYYTGELLSETLYTMLLALSIVPLGVYGIAQKRHVCASALMMGAAILTRPVVLFFPLWLAIYMLYEKSLTWRERVVRVLLYGTIVLAVLSPWMIRNAYIHKAFVPVTTEAGYQLYFSNNPLADGAGVYREGVYSLFRQEYAKIIYPYTREIDQQKALFRKGLDFIIHNPVRFIYLMYDKSIRFWNVLPQTSRRDQLISLGSYGVILPFFLGGLSTITRKDRVLILLIIVYVSLFHATVSYGSVRFRVPIEPYIIVIAAAVMRRFLRDRQGESS